MKFRLLLLLSLVSTTVLAQVQKDTVVAPKDSVKITPFVINHEKPQKKRKPKPEPDSTGYAQEYNRNDVGFQWGIRAGGGLNSLTTKEVSAVRIAPSGTPLLENGRIIRDQVLSNKDMVMGYLGGFFVRMTRGFFYLQPEIFYNRKGGKFDILQSDGRLFKRVNTTYSAVNMPLLLGIRFRQARLFAGPMLEFPINFNDELKDAVKVYTNNDFKKDLFSRPSLGVSAGLGFEFKHFFIEGRFETSMGNLINYDIGPTSNPSKLQVSSRSLVLAIGFIK